MPYKNNSELPDSIKNNLPSHAQNIYREAFNHAFIEYQDPLKRRDAASVEETARKVAWAAVKKHYHKNKFGKWVSIK